MVRHLADTISVVNRPGGPCGGGVHLRCWQMTDSPPAKPEGPFSAARDTGSAASIGSEDGKTPNLLHTFLKWLIAGNRHLDGDVDENVAILSMDIIV